MLQPLHPEFFHWRRIGLKPLLMFVVIVSACKPKPDTVASTSPPPPVYFSKNWRAEMGFPHYYTNRAIFRAACGDLVALLPIDNALLQSASSDNGKTWSSPQSIFTHEGLGVPIFGGGRLLGAITIEKVANGGQFYFHARLNDGWFAPSPIRDTNWGDFSDPIFAADSLGNFYFAWKDGREGNADIYFSASADGGKTWQANVRIDDDQTGQEQSDGVLMATTRGGLYAFWADNREPKTLFDIYCSSSDDGGKTWRPSRKVNDDTTHSFQITPAAVVDSQGVLDVVWRDYRDKGASGDLLANIYFARSEDGGKSWRPNVRLSRAQYGHNWSPCLNLTANGQLHGLWCSSEDNALFDVLYSHSRDGGQTWSAPARVNDDRERVQHDHRGIGWLGSAPPGNNLIGWLDWREEQPAIYMAERLEHPDATRPEREPQRHAAINITEAALRFESGETLFQDDFVEAPSSQWKSPSGAWVCKDQTYIGYGAREAQSFAGSALWDNYVFQGRFKLDPIDHRTAFIYLRVSKGKDGQRCYYRLNHYFRIGIALEYFDGKFLRQLAETPYPFQKDTWYEFRTVVQGNTLNHFIDDSLLIATDQLIHNSRGKVGVGASVTPTYFKDILVTAIK